MKNKLIILLFFIATLAVLTACSGKSEFTVVGKIAGLGETNVHVAYLNADGAVDEKWVGVKDDAFQFKGEVAEATLVMLSDGQGRPLARLVIEGGDEITIEGEKEKLNELQIKGNETSEQWYKFIAEHTAQYQQPDQTALNKEIEKYVTDHPEELLSTLLLLVDYSGENRDKLLGQIKDKAKPASLLMDYNELQALLTKQGNAPLKTMKLFGARGDFDSFSPNAAAHSLIIFWDNASSTARRNILNRLEQQNVTDKNAQLADIYMEGDSSGWRSKWQQDPIDGIVHYWAPQGAMHEDLKDLNITTLPTIIVVDSTGAQRYRGADANAALKKLD